MSKRNKKACKTTAYIKRTMDANQEVAKDTKVQEVAKDTKVQEVAKDTKVQEVTIPIDTLMTNVSIKEQISSERMRLIENINKMQNVEDRDTLLDFIDSLSNNELFIVLITIDMYKDNEDIISSATTALKSSLSKENAEKLDKVMKIFLKEADAKKKAEEAKRKAEEDAKKKAEEAKRKAEEDAKKKAEEAKKKAEEEAKKKAEEAKKKAEEEAKKKAEESKNSMNILEFLVGLKDFTNNTCVLGGIDLAIANCNASIMIPRGIKTLEDMNSKIALSCYEYLPQDIVASSILKDICKAIKDYYKNNMDWIERGITSNLVK